MHIDIFTLDGKRRGEGKRMVDDLKKEDIKELKENRRIWRQLRRTETPSLNDLFVKFCFYFFAFITDFTRDA